MLLTLPALAGGECHRRAQVACRSCDPALAGGECQETPELSESASREGSMGELTHKHITPQRWPVAPQIEQPLAQF